MKGAKNMKNPELIKYLTDELLDEQLGRLEYKHKFAALCSFLYKEQVNFAKDAKRYEFRYHESLDKCEVSVSDVLTIIGMANSLEAELIFKENENAESEGADD